MSLPMQPMTLSLVLTAAAWQLLGCGATTPSRTGPPSTATSVQASTPSPVQPPLLIRGARIFDGESVSAATDVLVEGSQIVEVGLDLHAPANADVVDAQGMTLLPGLIDTHAHTWEPAQLRQAAVFGVTTELDMMGNPSQLKTLRQQLRDGRLTDGADLRSAGSPFTAPAGHGTEYGFFVPTIVDPQQAAAFVRARIAEGSDYIKFMFDDGQAWGLHTPSLSVPLLNAGIAAAHAENKLALVHAGSVDEARKAVQAKADGLMHLWVGSAPSELIQEIRRQQSFVVPTLSVMLPLTGRGQGKELIEDPKLAPFLSQQAVGHLYADSNFAVADDDVRFVENLASLYSQGVPILVGTDSGNDGVDHGVTMHGELRLLTEAGVSNIDALRGATSLPATIFGLRDRGRIAKGLLADLLLVRGDPTTQIRATRDIVAVWRMGKRIDREKHRKALASRSRPPIPAAPPKSIGDFEATESNAPFGRGWSASTDRVRGGKSSVTLALAVGGASGTEHALHVAGTMTPSQLRYPWSGVFYSPGAGMMQPADLSGWKELVFWARGGGAKFYVMFFLVSSGERPHIQTFAAKPDWAEYHFDFRKFGGTIGSDVRGIFFGAQVPGDYWFELDRVELR